MSKFEFEECFKDNEISKTLEQAKELINFDPESEMSDYHQNLRKNILNAPDLIKNTLAGIESFPKDELKIVSFNISEGGFFEHLKDYKSSGGRESEHLAKAYDIFTESFNSIMELIKHHYKFNS